MPNKILTSYTFDRAEIVNILFSEKDSIEIRLQNETQTTAIKLETEHDKDCCEHVYSDTSLMEPHVTKLEGEFLQRLQIVGVEELGYMVCFDAYKVLINCYNSQNGYYCDELKLKVTIEHTELIDLEEYKEAN